MITIKNVSKKFEKKKVLQKLSLEVKTGETLVILGRSGIGKSVLLKHIIGLMDPDEGTIEVDGIFLHNLKGSSLYHFLKKMGMLFQGAALFDSMTIAENTSFYLREHGKESGEKYTEEEIKTLVDNALEMVGLSGVQNQLPSDLSGGMRKRAALARLIVYRPTYLLYDEPTTGLDPITAMQINELIVKTQKTLQSTSIVVTHDVVSALYIADRLALIEEGAIVHIDTPEKFIEIDHPVIDALKKTVSQNPRSLRNLS